MEVVHGQGTLEVVTCVSSLGKGDFVMVLSRMGNIFLSECTLRAD